MQLDIAGAEQILRRFSGRGPKCPTLAAAAELDRAVRAAFIAHYLADPAPRGEIHEGLQVVEQLTRRTITRSVGAGRGSQ